MGLNLKRRNGHWQMKVYFEELYITKDKEWTQTYNVSDTIKLLATRKVTELSVGEEGKDVLIWIDRAVVLSDFKSPKITIHTMNPELRKELQTLIRNIETR